jgi:YgiT-type zinc finger domain-containing protein
MGSGFQQEEIMKCQICRNGETAQGLATFTPGNKSTTLVFREVPAEICTNCGEEYVDAEVAGRLYRLAEEATRSGVQVDVRKYIAA